MINQGTEQRRPLHPHTLQRLISLLITAAESTDTSPQIFSVFMFICLLLCVTRMMNDAYC